MNLKLVAQTEQSPPSGERRAMLAWFTVVLVCSTVAVTVLAVAMGSDGVQVNPWAVGILVLLTIAGSHSEEVFGDDTALNGSIVVILASAGIAYAGGPLWVAGACGMVAGLHRYHVRDREFRKILVNTSFTTLSALVAAEVARALTTSHPGALAVASSGLAAVAAYWLVDNVLVAFVLAVAYGKPLSAHVRDLIRSETEVLPFALLGFVDGYAFVKVSPWFAITGAAALLIVTEVLVVRSHRSAGSRRSAAWVLWAAPVIVAAGVLLNGGLGGVRHGEDLLLLGTIGLVGVAVLDHFRSSFGLSALVACVVAAVIEYPSDRSTSVAIVVGFVACAGFIMRRRRGRNRLVSLSAAAIAVLAVVGLVDVFEPLLVTREWTFVFAAVGSLAAVVVWHAIVGLILALDVGKSVIPSAVALMQGEVGFVLLAAVCGAGVGWIGVEWGSASSATALVAMLAIAGLLIAWVERRNSAVHEPVIADDELLDVLRSAVLDVPASRVPD